MMNEASGVEEKTGDRMGRMALAVRSAIGGGLMGLANLVPGISGGTMLLASGVYPRFVRAIAEVTTFKFRVRSLLVLGVVAGTAALTILVLAGGVKDLVVQHRWVMYSLFIGLTLGGVPVIWKMARPVSTGWVLGALGGFLAMAALTLAQQHNPDGGGGEPSPGVMLFLAGLAGASAMILPGISGGYLLLVLRQYVPILAGISDFRAALGAREVAEIIRLGLTVLTPVGLGVVAGVVVISNVLRMLLVRYEKPTLGVLMGLLLGAVVGLWPFQEGVEPVPGDVIKGRVVTSESLAEIDMDDWPTRRFQPTGGQVGASLGWVLAGLACTAALARFGSERRDEEQAPMV